MAQILSQAEADALISMPKRKVLDETIRLSLDTKINFKVVGEDALNKFVIDVEIKGSLKTGLSIQGRLDTTNIVLMRLDVNPARPHKNPDDSVVRGSHIHRFSAEYGVKMAESLDIDGLSLIECCKMFFKEFNVIDYPALEEK